MGNRRYDDMFDLARNFFDSDLFRTDVLDRRITLPPWGDSDFYGTAGLASGFKETEDGGYQLKLELPGYKKDEVDVQLSKHTITVNAHRKDDERTKSFTSTIPSDLDPLSVVAELDLGVLRVTAIKYVKAHPDTVKIPVK